MQVVAKNLRGAEEFARQWDKETEDWDTVKSMTTVVDNLYYEEADLKAEADEIMAGTRESLALYSIAATAPAGALPGNNSGFNLQKPQEDDGVGELPMADSTDED